MKNVYGTLYKQVNSWKKYAEFGIMILIICTKRDSMDLRTIREDITYEYAEGKNYKIIERTFFSNAGYMYLIFDEEHNEKSLFVTSLEKDQEHLINSYIKLVEIYRVNKILKDIKIEINEIDDKGFVIFILMEPNMVLKVLNIK